MEEEICEHSNVFEDDNGLIVCEDCGTETEILDFKPEWNYYGSSDNRSVKDPSRCQQKRSLERDLTNDFESHRVVVTENIKSQVEERFNRIVGNTTVKGKLRRAIVAACLFYVQRDNGEYRTSEYIRKKFCLDRRDMSKGNTHYLSIFFEEREKTTSPSDLVPWFMKLSGVGMEHTIAIQQLVSVLENSSLDFKRSKPQSVAASVVYFYLCLKPEYKKSLGITKSEFAKRTQLSDITITKLVKSASKITNKNVEI